VGGSSPGAAARPSLAGTALIPLCTAFVFALECRGTAGLASLPAAPQPSSPSEGVIRDGFPPGGALESANMNVSVAVFSRTPSGRETVTGDADVLILNVPKSLFARSMLVRQGTALHTALCRNTHVHL